MSRVVLMCGPAGSGKSTVARALVAQGMRRLSIDDEAWRRGFRSMPLPEPDRCAIEDTLREELRSLIRTGHSVVVDFSFWSREMRDSYRELLLPLGVTPETIYVTTARGTALARVADRTNSGPDDFRLTSEIAARYFDGFEPPTASEGPLTVVVT